MANYQHILHWPIVFLFGLSYWCKDLHDKDRTVSPLSFYLYNRNAFTWKEGPYIEIPPSKLSLTLAAISNKTPEEFSSCDWRFNEFPNPAAHALMATCIELMALPLNSQTVGTALLDIILKG